MWQVFTGGVLSGTGKMRQKIWTPSSKVVYVF